ncbi:hypothetical protein [Vibrio agarivorans]|uniref:Uncharacterized protein n=1 Tax=Vibrio agarivorans TaxID=153622 RepID=A0ABT7Y1M1_9VIBR|nr:hypothetical protein [Vibrio agarivorans]MDN2481654.1 hypothetical protein [Vibrio agarivorans]
MNYGTNTKVAYLDLKVTELNLDSLTKSSRIGTYKEQMQYAKQNWERMSKSDKRKFVGDISEVFGVSRKSVRAELEG